MSQPISPLPNSKDELLEEALAEFQKCLEEGKTGRDEVFKRFEQEGLPSGLQELERAGFLTAEAGRLRFSKKGESAASDVTRRYRLSERLMTDVLNLPLAAIGPMACKFEHILSKEAADSICTLLGHPKRCPHERPIPGGSCCKTGQRHASSVVFPLEKLEAGRRARLAYLVFKENPELERLLSMGMVPGRELVLVQKFPAFVVEVSGAQLAFDKGIAHHIFVRPL